MDYSGCHRLTFSGLLVAFLELAFAYCLLCVSIFVFITSKFLGYLPCPCSGILGYQNSDLCIKTLIFDWPFTIILRIQKLARTKLWYHHGQDEKIKDKNLDLINKVRLLEETVEEERAASASATDEAMAMILRLQEDKASLEMEWKQYERMIEQKLAYDEEEMNILKEILFKIEREKHFLEKELETYKQITDDHEPIVYDVHVIEDNNDAKMKQKDRDDDKMKQMKDIVKDHE